MFFKGYNDNIFNLMNNDAARGFEKLTPEWNVMGYI